MANGKSKVVPQPIQAEPSTENAGILESVNEADMSNEQVEQIEPQVIQVARDPKAVHIEVDKDEAKKAMAKAQRQIEKKRLKEQLAILESQDDVTEEEIAAEEAELAKEAREVRARKRASRDEDLDEEEEFSAAEMSHRRFMAYQNAKAKKKFDAVQIGNFPVPPGCELSDREKRIVVIELPMEVDINHVKYGPGRVKVPQHVADSLIPIIYRKTNSDLQVFTGKNFRVTKNLAGIVSKVEVGATGLDLKKMVNGGR